MSQQFDPNSYYESWAFVAGLVAGIVVTGIVSVLLSVFL